MDDGQFIRPGGVYMDSSDNVYVSDFGENNRIQKFDSNGTFIMKWGTEGTGDEPTGITIDSLGDEYVANRGNSRIQVFAFV